MKFKGTFNSDIHKYMFIFSSVKGDFEAELDNDILHVNLTYTGYYKTNQSISLDMVRNKVITDEGSMFYDDVYRGKVGDQSFTITIPRTFYPDDSFVINQYITARYNTTTPNDGGVVNFYRYE